MSNIYLFGDTHGELEIDKVFSQVSSFANDDFIIVCGDFGVLWDYKVQNRFFSKKEKKIIKKIEQLPCELLFVDGNHENFDRINTLPRVQRFGGEVGEYIKDKCYHLRRGNIYEIAGKNVLTFGGALSIDKAERLHYEAYTRKRVWWAGEAITALQLERGLENIAKFGGNIDIVVTHTCPASFLRCLAEKIDIEYKLQDENAHHLERILEALIAKQKNEALEWFFGHWHEDFDFSDDFGSKQKIRINAHLLYNEAFDFNAKQRKALNYARL